MIYWISRHFIDICSISFLSRFIWALSLFILSCVFYYWFVYVFYSFWKETHGFINSLFCFLSLYNIAFCSKILSLFYTRVLFRLLLVFQILNMCLWIIDIIFFIFPYIIPTWITMGFPQTTVLAVYYRY